MRSTRIIPIILFCLYMAAVAFICFSNPKDMPQIPSMWFGLPADKVAHFIMFCPYPILAYLTFDIKNMSLPRKASVLILILITGMGVAIGTEQIQASLSYRDGDIYDLYADGAGLAAGAVFTWAYIILRKHR